jgi:hypothetical protein
VATINPVWQPAITGTGGAAGHVNQLLVSHESTVSYGGTLQASATSGAGVYGSSGNTWLAQRFVTGATQTSIGYIALQLNAVGGSPTLPLIPSLSVGLYADASGIPSGAALATASLTGQYVYTSGFWVTVPIAVSGLAPSTGYQIVAGMAGDSSHYFAWQHSTATGGAATSPDGAAWTDQAYGLMFQVFDQSGGGSTPLLIIEDAGARVTSLSYTSADQLGTLAAYTTGTAGTVSYSATLSYSNGLLTGVG